MTVTIGKIGEKRYKLLQLFAALALVIYFSTVNVFADDDKAREISNITVLLENSESNIVIGNEDVYLYKIAEFTDYKTHSFKLESDFEDVAMQLDLSSAEKTCSLENAQKLIKYITENDIKHTAYTVSDEKGYASFGTVDNGIYLVSFGDNEAFSVSEFIIEAPLYENGEYIFDVTASPKITPRPDVSSPDTSKTDSSVPDTSSSGVKIPQTGQIKLPIPILLIAGITLLIFGYVDGKRNRDENNEK